MSNIQHLNFGCRHFLADGKTLSGFVPHTTEEGAIKEALSWRELGYKADAVETLYNWESHTIYRRQLV